MYSQDFPNFGGFSLMYKSSNAPLAFKTIDREIRDTKYDMVYVNFRVEKTNGEKSPETFTFNVKLVVHSNEMLLSHLFKRQVNSSEHKVILTVPERCTSRGWMCIQRGLRVLHQSFLN